MKFIVVIILLISKENLFAQSNSISVGKPVYGIHVTTMNDNMLRGLLLKVKDTSLAVYPGKFKEWKNHERYMPVEFGYHNIQELTLQRKHSALKGMLIGGGIGLSAIAASFLVSQRGTRTGGYQYAIPLLPFGMIVGGIIGSRNQKRYYINGSRPLFAEFQKISK
jgi:hypothetical protein